MKAKDPFMYGRHLGNPSGPFITSVPFVDHPFQGD